MSDLILTKGQIEKIIDAIELGKEAMYCQIEEDLSFLRRSIVEYMGMPPKNREYVNRYVVNLLDISMQTILAYKDEVGAGFIEWNNSKNFIRIMKSVTTSDTLKLDNFW